MTLADLDPGTVFMTDEAPGERFVFLHPLDRVLAMCEHEGDPNHMAVINLAAEVQILQLPGSSSRPAAGIGSGVSRDTATDPAEPPLGAIAAGWLMLALSGFGAVGWTAEHGFIPMGAFGTVLTVVAFVWLLRLTRVG